MTDHATRMMEIAECEFCDDNGIHLNGIHACDHIDYASIAKRGIALVRAAIEEAKSCSR